MQKKLIALGLLKIQIKILHGAMVLQSFKRFKVHIMQMV